MGYIPFEISKPTTMVAHGNGNDPAHVPLREQKLISSVLQAFHDARRILQYISS